MLSRNLVFNTGFITYATPLLNSLLTKFVFLSYRTKLSRREYWAHRVIRRHRRFQRNRFNYRIFFSKKNVFFRALLLVLEFTRSQERLKFYKRQIFFFNFLRYIYGIKRVKILQTNLIKLKKKRKHSSKLQLFLDYLESQLIVVLVRMGFAINLAWSRYIILRGLVLVNTLKVIYISKKLFSQDIVTILSWNYMDVTKIFTVGIDGKSNYINYRIWLLFREFFLFKGIRKTKIKRFKIKRFKNKKFRKENKMNKKIKKKSRILSFKSYSLLKLLKKRRFLHLSYFLLSGVRNRAKSWTRKWYNLKYI